MGLFDETQTRTTSRFAPSLFNILTSGGSNIQTAQTGPDTFKAGVTLPQDIQALRAENLGGIRSLLQSIRGEGGSILNARLSPLRDQITQRRGALQRDLGRRNVMGTLANNELRNFDMASSRALGDARALGTRDLIDAESMLNDRIGGAANSLLGQELASLGISQDAIRTIINSMSAQTETSKTSDFGGTLEGITNILDVLGKI